MKKIAFILMTLVMTMSISVMADNDRVINFNQLPAQSQTMLKKHFAGKTPMIITADWDDYKVVYNTGEKVEFRKNGEWKELSSPGKGVPAALIPAQIKANVKSSFPGAVIIKIDRDREGYDVKLNNGMELEFNKRFQLVDMDD